MLTQYVRRTALVAALVLSAGPLAAASALTLPEAERLALQRDPLSDRFDALAGALEEEAVADAQLPDPKLKFGLQALPTDSFDRDQEAMTQLQLGIVQAFPRGRSREFKAQQNRALAAAQRARGDDQGRRSRRAVRLAFLDLWLQQRSVELLEENRNTFRQLVTAARSQYAAGRDAQQDVLRADLELSLLEDRLARVRGDVEAAQSELARWVGEAAGRPLQAERPTLPGIPDAALLEATLTEHPLVRAEQAETSAGRAEVDLARQLYRPGFSLDITYGNRLDAPDGSERSDLLSATVVMDLPLFPDKRQDRRLAAGQQRLSAAQLALDERRLELERQSGSASARWQTLVAREAHYRDEVIPRTGQTARAARNAYQSRTGGINDVLRATLAELDARLQAVRIATDRAKAEAELLYLSGE